MSRQPSEQNLPDNVTNADIEKHFGYAPGISKCSTCGQSFYTDDMIEEDDKDADGEFLRHCKRCEREQF